MKAPCFLTEKSLVLPDSRAAVKQVVERRHGGPETRYVWCEGGQGKDSIFAAGELKDARAPPALPLPFPASVARRVIQVAFREREDNDRVALMSSM